MLSLVSQIGIMILVSILGCTLVGKYIDEKLNTRYIFTIIMMLLGIGGAFMSVYKTLIVYIKRK